MRRVPVRPSGTLPPTPDLFGAALSEYLGGARQPAHLRRSDGRLAVLDLSRYFASYAFFAPLEQGLISRARGDVLDLGAGAGRAALYLQELAAGGLPEAAPVRTVLAVDSSPGACLCLRRRGVINVFNLSWLDLPGEGIAGGGFDTVILLGTGLGMAGSRSGLAKLLSTVSRLLRPGGEALVTGAASGPQPCAARMRVEYGQRVGEWFDWLEVPFAVLAETAAGCGLMVVRGPLTAGDGEYGVVLAAR